MHVLEQNPFSQFFSLSKKQNAFSLPDDMFPLLVIISDSEPTFTLFYAHFTNESDNILTCGKLACLLVSSGREKRSRGHVPEVAVRNATNNGVLHGRVGLEDGPTGAAYEELGTCF